jgi:transcription elongation factor Elf1
MDNCTMGDIPRNSDFLLQLNTSSINITEFSCPKNGTYKVRGSLLEESSTYIHVKVTRCDKRYQKNCKGDFSDINNMVKFLDIQFYFTNSNFDQKDLYDPVKNYFDTRLKEGFMPGYVKQYEIAIQNSSAKMFNDYLLIDPPQELRFY